MTTSTPVAGEHRSHLGLLVLLGALSAFGPLSFDMYLPALPVLARDLGSSDAGAQLSLSVCMLGLGIGQVVTGPLSDQLGRKSPMVAGIALFTVSSVACAVAPSLGFLLVMRFLQGLGGGAGAVIARSIVRDLFSGREAAHAFGVTALVFGIAPVVAPLVGSLLLGVTGWRGIFVTIAGCGLVLLLATTRVPETLPPSERHDGGVTRLFADFPRVLADRTFLAPALLAAIAFMPLQLYLSMGSFALQEHYGLTPQQFGYLFAVNSLGILAAGRLNLAVVRHAGPYRVLVGVAVVNLLACGALALAALTGAPTWAFVVPLFIAIASVGPLMPNCTTLALENQSHVVGAASACFGLVSTVVGSAVPPAVSTLGATPVVLGVAMAVAATLAVGPLLAVPQDMRGRLHH